MQHLFAYDKILKISTIIGFLKAFLCSPNENIAYKASDNPFLNGYSMQNSLITSSLILL